MADLVQVSLGRRIVRLVYALSMFIPLWVGAGYAGARYATRVRPIAIEPRDKMFGLEIESVSTKTDDGVVVCGWLVRRNGGRVVILLPPHWETREACVKRAEIYLENDWSVLLPDLRGTGESGGQVCSFGWQERKDVLAWGKWLEDERFRHIGVHGISTGAAAAVYALRERENWAFLVLECCYDRFENWLKGWVSWLPQPRVALFPMLLFGKQRIGTTIDQLVPIDIMDRCAVPTLFLGADQDRLTDKAQVKAMFDACHGEPKRMHLFAGERGDDLMLRYRDQYRTVLREFVSQR